MLRETRTPPDCPSNILSVEVEGVCIDALVDTGASVSVISAQLSSRLRKVRTPYTGPSLRGANGDKIRPSGYCTVRVMIDGLLHHIQCAVLTLCAYDLILGWDFLSASSAVISCRQPAIHLTETAIASVSDAPIQRLVATEDCVLPPGEETVYFVACDNIADGDVFVTPAGSFACKGAIIPPCLVRFSRG